MGVGRVCCAGVCVDGFGEVLNVASFPQSAEMGKELKFPYLPQGPYFLPTNVQELLTRAMKWRAEVLGILIHSRQLEIKIQACQAILHPHPHPDLSKY